MNKLILLIGLGFYLKVNAQLVDIKPSAEMMKQGQQQFKTHCVVCHNNDGTKTSNSPALKGSKIATGSINGIIHMVMTGGPQHKMPNWSISQLSNQELAEVLTYIRNAWGNDNKKRYGEDAGGIVTPELVKKQRNK